MTRKPLPYTNVFLNGTTRGALTDEHGVFSLSTVPLGSVELVASFVGYQVQRQTIRLEDKRARTVDFSLKPDEKTLATVTVKTNASSREWQRQFRQFKRQLLGEPFGNQCIIKNSDVLSFFEEDGHLRATATAPLIIENNALGYRLHYSLTHFDGTNRRVYYAGSSRFEVMESTDERLIARQHRNRMVAYTGSTRHLMASLAAGTYEKEGFLVYQEDVSHPMAMYGNQSTLAGSIGPRERLHPLVLPNLVRPGRLPNERQLMPQGQLVIFYTRASSSYSPYRDAPYAYSVLTTPKGPVQFTTEGWMTTANGLEIQGSLADDRLSTLLPTDWKPLPTVIGTVATTRGRQLAPDARLKRLREAFSERFQYVGPTVFAHVDKPFYLTGDPIWFSTYLLDTPTMRQLVGETALHVDLRTAAGQLVQHQWVHIADGRGAGSFRLSDTLATGTYQLRAYTDEDDRQHRPAFERSIAVYNLQQGTGAMLLDPVNQAPDIQFLPEGGRWLIGQPSRIGIKITGPDGLGRTGVGQILDATNTVVGEFTCTNRGMGSLMMTPQAGRTYHAAVQVDGKTNAIQLPAADAAGLALGVDAVSDSR